MMELPRELRELRSKLLEIDNLVLMDGTHVGGADIFEEAMRGPEKCAHLLESRSDSSLVSLFKHRYLMQTMWDRIPGLRKNGIPIVVTGGMSFNELILGAGCTTFGITPCFMQIYGRGDFSLQDEGHKFTSFESCPWEPVIAVWVRDGTVPADMVLSATGANMGDMPCVNNLLRGTTDVPLHYIEIPYGSKGKPWAVNYLAGQLRTTFMELGKVAGRKLTDDDLRAGISQMNGLRAAFRELIDIVDRADVPPLSGMELLVASFGIFDLCGDPVGLLDATQELTREVRERVKGRVRGFGVPENPIRIYQAEKMVPLPTFNFIEDLGGTLVGCEVCDCLFQCKDVEEIGDPFESLARWMIEEWPWSGALPIEERAQWLMDRIRKTRADGVIFIGVWGCQWDPLYARYLSDTIREELGIPSLIMLLEDIPVEFDEVGRYKMKGDWRTRTEAFMEVLKTRRS